MKHQAKKRFSAAFHFRMGTFSQNGENETQNSLIYEGFFFVHFMYCFVSISTSDHQTLCMKLKDCQLSYMYIYIY